MTEDNSIFAQVLKAQKQLQAEVTQKKNFIPGEYEETEYCSIEHFEKVIRPVGNPYDPHTLVSEKDTDNKIFMQSQVALDDETKYVKINWPAKIKTTHKGISIIPDPDFILTKLYNKVMERQWISYPQGKVEIRNGKECTGEYVYVHRHTKIYERIEKNGTRGEMNKFKPTPYVVMNVIDRSDEWCDKNKHTKILISKMTKGTPKKNEITGEITTPLFPSPGVSVNFYEKLRDKSIQISKGYNKDFVVKKTGQDLETKYLSFPATQSRVDEGDISMSSFRISKEEGLPPDWKMYNIAQRTNPSSAFKIKKNLENLFKLYDATFNEHLLEELNELVNIEHENYQKTHSKTEAEQNLSHQIQEQAAIIKMEENSFEVNSDKLSRISATTKTSIEDQCKEFFPKFDLLSDIDKKILVESVICFNLEGIPVWKESAESSPCSVSNCYHKGTFIQTNFPFAMKKCPMCGQVYG